MATEQTKWPPKDYSNNKKHGHGKNRMPENITSLLSNNITSLSNLLNSITDAF